MSIIECHSPTCRKHARHQGCEEPLCFEEECKWEPLVPLGYSEDDLEMSNPYNQWMYGG